MLDKKEQHQQQPMSIPQMQIPNITNLNKRKSQNRLPDELEEESKERVETYASDVRVTNLSEADVPFQGSKLSLGAIKQRLSNTLNYNTYNNQKEKTGKKLDQIEENNNQPSHTSEDFFGTNPIEPSKIINDGVSSPRILHLHKRNNRTRSIPIDKDEQLVEMPKLSSQLDMSPNIDSRVEDHTPFDHSNVSEYYRVPHTIFQHKRSAIPTLNLHGSTTSFTGKDSLIGSPFKVEHVPKNLYEAESELNQELKKSKDPFYVDDQKSRIEHVSMLEMNEDRSEIINDSVARQVRGTSKVEPVMQQKLKNVIKPDISVRKPKQDNKSAIKLDESASRKMKNSFVSIDNEKLSVQSRRRFELSQKEGTGSSRRTISRQEISDRDLFGLSSSKRNIFAKMSPIQPLKIADIHRDEMLETLKVPKGVEEENEEEHKSQAEVFPSPKQSVEVARQKTIIGTDKKPGQVPTYSEESDVSMGELIQQELMLKMAMEAKNGKKTIPTLALPSFSTEKGHLYGVDAKYAGSPRDHEQHSDKEDEKPKRTMLRKTENPQTQVPSLALKKAKIPVLKVSGLTREEKHPPLHQHQQEIEKIQDMMGGTMTGLEQSLSASNSKMQVAMDAKRKHHSPKVNLKNLTKEFPLTNTNMDEILTENLFYYSERKLRKIYEDDELHVLVLSLMISLLLTPNRGILDEHYTSQYPIDDNKPNILYIMHFHLNHPSNQHILPLLLQRMAEINPYPAGQRLLKLLCISFSDLSIYTDKKKIGGGAYGVVFECNTNLADPRTVAIKETKFPSSIHDRCALHDIFTEITCLEQFRLDPAVTDIYDYGVTDSSYIIVMKKYPVSLREWRNKQEGSWMDNLPTYLTIYKDVLKTVSMLHSNNITHYDLKCDNVLLDYKTNNNMQWNSESDIRVVLGDFGECKMFTSEQDEFCVRNRGTEYIKSPEMLTIAINCKREADNFDRRRKVGTTRASDIWSLGCLLYEILTGDFLFYDQDWIQFYIRVTSAKENLLTEERLNKIGNNVYIVDFLKYILVREPQHRPSINNVLKRFEHIHAILVSNITYFDHYELNLPAHASAAASTSLEGTLESYIELLFPNQAAIQEKITIPHKLKHPPTYMKIMDEISICAKTYFLTNLDKLVRNGVTHVITTSSLIDEKYLARFRYMTLNLTDDQRLHMLPYIFAPKLMDYLRVVFLQKGNILFVEDDNISINSKPAKLVLRTALLFCLTHVFKCSVYETWTLINSQILFFSLPFSHLSMMSNLMVHHLKISQFVHSLPKIQCICGCCTLVLKRQFSLDKNINTKPCSCSRETKTIEFSDCPSDGCTEYMKYIKEKYRIPWEALKWAYFSPQDIFIGPKGTGTIQEKFQVKIILNSEGILENSIPYSKKYRKTSISYASVGSPNKDKWELYQCKYCLMWLFAENKIDQKYAVLTNNMIKQKQGGIMMPQAQFGHKIRAPTLRNFKLSELR